MRFRRLTLVANVVIVGATLPAVVFPTAVTSGGALPLYEYVNIGPGTWSSQPVAAELGGHTILGSAHGASGDGLFALSARLENGDLGLFVRNATGTTSFSDVSSSVNAPPAAADPTVFIDPYGNPGLAYVSTNKRLILITTNSLRSPRRAHLSTPLAPAPYVVTDVSIATHVPMTPGTPAVSVSGASGVIFDRSAHGAAIAIALQWRQLALAPSIGPSSNITTLTASPTLGGDPVSLATSATGFAAVTSTGHVIFFARGATSPFAWTATDLTNTTGAPTSAGPLSWASNGTLIDVASLSASGHVELFTTTTAKVPLAHSLTNDPRASFAPSPPSPRVGAAPVVWKYQDLTAVLAGSPVWAGHLVVSANPATIDIAGRAANWGDLYDNTYNVLTQTWTSTDVSLDAGSTVSAAGGVSAISVNGTLELYAVSDGVASPRGVGVYAIPFNDWGRAISDGWPIISETGGLGTLTAPWISYPSPATVSQSPDFLMGQSIAAAKKRETWLSFWTVSGPLSPATQTSATYYSHGYLAGQWVAQQIDQYRLHGVNLKPNWVILDPEGYPDNHSALDAPAGASPATIARYASFWTAMLQGWSAGLTQVDPSLHPGVYAEQSEYRNYGLTNLTMPVFEAIAFGGGGPVRIAGSNGHNILGYIAFNATCTPTSALRNQEHTLVTAPWAGQFNTLQFNFGVYCAP